MKKPLAITIAVLFCVLTTIIYFPFHSYSNSSPEVSVSDSKKILNDKVSKDLEEEIEYEPPIIDISLINSWRRNGGFYRDLSVGYAGEDVRVLEEYLRNVGSGISKVDDYFGTETERILKRYQVQNVILPVDGKLSGLTRNKIQQHILASYCPMISYESEDATYKPVSRDISVDKEYVPNKLEVLPGEVDSDGIICLRQDVANSYKEMYEAMKEEDLHIKATSGYRRYELQDNLYDHRYQMRYQYPSVAIPGHSEHQLGVAIDISAKSQNYLSTSKALKYTKEYKWMLENAHKYGFVLSYPEGKEEITGYTFEPWHWRYVGTEVAYDIVESGLTPVEYLRNFQKVALGKDSKKN